MPTVDRDPTNIITHLKDCGFVEKNDLIKLLGLTDHQDIRLLFRAARDVRARYFGTKIFLYGFLYFSTHCRNDCNFCQYRKSNTALPRYRKTAKEILAAAIEMAEAGVHLIDLTMGEDPHLYTPSEPGFLGLIALIKEVQKETGLPVMISPGALPDTILRELADIGVSWFACYQETHNPALYQELRTGQSFMRRLAKKQLAQKSGMLIEEGILTGVGENLGDLADSLLWMKDFPVDQARVMTFVPQAGTPMAEHQAQDSLKELVIIAVMRLMLQDILIPASLDVHGLDGLKARLNAGANVVTSIIPSQKGLAGVANNSLDIEDSRRSLKHILPIIRDCGLCTARPGDFRAWVADRQKILALCTSTSETILC